jgi:hypothetical protein
MLTKILDTTGIDMEDSEIVSELEIDLKRMDYLKHYEMPEGCNAYKVRVLTSKRTYMSGFHRFRFFIQYGTIINDELKPIGEEVFYQTETLPMI